MMVQPINAIDIVRGFAQLLLPPSTAEYRREWGNWVAATNLGLREARRRLGLPSPPG